MPRPIRTLLFSTLYPSVARPIHGIFVETRHRELLKTGEVESRVIAPVPWFPFSGKRWGNYGKFAETPKFEQRDGVDVAHPRYFLPPKVGMNMAPTLLAAGAMPAVKRLLRAGFDFDLIDAHYYYPDGVAAAIIARKLGKPFVVTGRGTDLNLLPEYPLPRRLILEAAGQASASICVSTALKDRLLSLGADPEKLHVFRNGVNLERFSPLDRAQARQTLGLKADGEILLAVGNLVELKGHHLLIQALPSLPSVSQLVIVGSGPELENLKSLARDTGVAQRVRFAGQVPNIELRTWYSAADALALCSSREGWANVLLESMACGTPVVATTISGTTELVTTPAAGQLMNERSVMGFLEAYRRLIASYPARDATRQHAARFGWEETSRNQIELFRRICHA